MSKTSGSGSKFARAWMLRDEDELKLQAGLHNRKARRLLALAAAAARSGEMSRKPLTPEQSRELSRLRAAGLSWRRVARVMGISPSRAWRWMQRGRLERSLTGEFFAGGARAGTRIAKATRSQRKRPRTWGQP